MVFLKTEPKKSSFCSLDERCSALNIFPSYIRHRIRHWQVWMRNNMSVDSTEYFSIREVDVSLSTQPADGQPHGAIAHAQDPLLNGEHPKTGTTASRMDEDHTEISEKRSDENSSVPERSAEISSTTPPMSDRDSTLSDLPELGPVEDDAVSMWLISQSSRIGPLFLPAAPRTPSETLNDLSTMCSAFPGQAFTEEGYPLEVVLDDAIEGSASTEGDSELNHR
ncbi:hypothetical protein QBC35DRAFT_223509 [Podospora australis]|uniref:Uncharacterized protein n=1 Tax=Podospora australis TaxID=1536484 RepID=A0AAN6X1V1_9PEZI|nr:hypothetical protein QBC35DRAFT_223509 [Podospora australis]